MRVAADESPTCIRIILIDDLPFRRAGMQSLLEHWAQEQGGRLDLVGTTNESSLTQLEQDTSLIVYNVGGTSLGAPDWRRNIDELRQRLPSVPLVVISDGDKTTDVVEALKAGARGFISAQTAPSIVFQALRFIMNGGVYFPPSALLQANIGPQPISGRRAASGDEPRHPRLTIKQSAVWRLLQRGLSNKVIARQLDMCESTVKVHMRQIMRKLGATNRTQAALCSDESGTNEEVSSEADLEVGKSGQ